MKLLNFRNRSRWTGTSVHLLNSPAFYCQQVDWNLSPLVEQSSILLPAGGLEPWSTRWTVQRSTASRWTGTSVHLLNSPAFYCQQVDWNHDPHDGQSSVLLPAGGLEPWSTRWTVQRSTASRWTGTSVHLLNSPAFYCQQVDWNHGPHDGQSSVLLPACGLEPRSTRWTVQRSTASRWTGTLVHSMDSPAFYCQQVDWNHGPLDGQSSVLLPAGGLEPRSTRWTVQRSTASRWTGTLVHSMDSPAFYCQQVDWNHGPLDGQSSVLLPAGGLEPRSTRWTVQRSTASRWTGTSVHSMDSPAFYCQQVDWNHGPLDGQSSVLLPAGGLEPWSTRWTVQRSTASRWTGTMVHTMDSPAFYCQQVDWNHGPLDGQSSVLLPAGGLEPWSTRWTVQRSTASRWTGTMVHSMDSPAFYCQQVDWNHGPLDGQSSVLLPAGGLEPRSTRWTVQRSTASRWTGTMVHSMDSPAFYCQQVDWNLGPLDGQSSVLLPAGGLEPRSTRWTVQRSTASRWTGTSVHSMDSPAFYCQQVDWNLGPLDGQSSVLLPAGGLEPWSTRWTVQRSTASRWTGTSVHSMDSPAFYCQQVDWNLGPLDGQSSVLLPAGGLEPWSTRWTVQRSTASRWTGTSVHSMDSPAVQERECLGKYYLVQLCRG